MNDNGPVIGETLADSTPWWPDAPQRRPNVLLVLLDDVGFSDFGCYGSEIDTPVIDRLAAEGLRYTGFHTTAMCSTTRAALLTGRNHHDVGMGCLANFDSGFPGYRGKIAADVPTLAEALRPHGYRNYLVGKWHATRLTETGPSGPFDGWPLGRGFDRYYGFLDAETDQFSPELVRDNTHVTAPGTYETGYHLTEDLIDEGLRYLKGHQAATPDVPWFLMVNPGACHAPHQAPRELIDKYAERFAGGWDETRNARLARQIDTGVVPVGTELPPRNDRVQAWADHSAEEQQLFARLQGAYAAMLEHFDTHLGRLIDPPRRLGAGRRHHRAGPVGQRRQPGGRTAGLHQRHGRVQHGPRADGGEARAHRRHRWSRHPHQLPVRVGDGGQHPAQALQAEHPRRRHPGPPGGACPWPGRRWRRRCGTSSATWPTWLRPCSTWSGSMRPPR